jgi:hypothetical protein
VIRIILFVGFFVFTAGAVLLRNYPEVRRGYLGIFIGCIFIAGLTGMTTWPIFGWGLYGNTVDANQSYYEPRIQGGDGVELHYDARAVEPAIPTPLTRHTRRMMTSHSADDREQLACFLLDQAQEYEPTTGAKRVLHSLQFPKHQYGPRWSEAEREAVRPISKLNIYHVDQQVAANGTTIRNRTRTHVYSKSIGSCS